MLLALTSFALAFDSTHATLQKVLTANVASGKVNYAAIKAAPADLDAYLAEVAAAPVSTLSASEKKALYINAYNAYTLDLLADNYPLTAITSLDGGKVWETRKFNVGGTQMTLNDIENKNLRTLGDPRIHAAVNCGAIGCPSLSSTVYLASSLESQLDAAAKKWASANAWSGTVLSINMIFDWYGEDFTAKYGTAYYDIPGLEGEQEAAANFIGKYASDRTDALKKGGYTVSFTSYNWNLNSK